MELFIVSVIVIFTVACLIRKSYKVFQKGSTYGCPSCANCALCTEAARGREKDRSGRSSPPLCAALNTRYTQDKNSENTHNNE